jgi:hypothetical protein
MTSITPADIHAFEIGKDCSLHPLIKLDGNFEDYLAEYLAHPCKLILQNGEVKTCTLTHVEINTLRLAVKIFARIELEHRLEHFEVEPCGFICSVPTQAAIKGPYKLGCNQKAQEDQWDRPTAQQILDAIFHTN